MECIKGQPAVVCLDLVAAIEPLNIDCDNVAKELNHIIDDFFIKFNMTAVVNQSLQIVKHLLHVQFLTLVVMFYRLDSVHHSDIAVH